MSAPKTVLVTGASGFIAKHIVLRLLSAGHTVRGSVRKLERGEEVRAAVAPHLDDPAALERLSFVALDLNSDDGWDAALAGTDALIHTASPFPLVQPDDPEEVIRPAVDGALRALRAAKAAGVGRVILTSSSAAITNAPLPPDGSALTEADWSPDDAPTATPYSRSKTLAERAAWDYVADLDLTVINPAFVLGPPLDAQYGTSVKVIERILEAKDPMLPRFGFPTVDVRDVAEMHVRALDRPETAGKRYIAADRPLWYHEMAEILQAAFPDRKIPTRQAPNLVVRFLGLFDKSIRTILPVLGRLENVSNARAVAEMGMTFIDAAEAVRETGRFLVDRKIV